MNAAAEMATISSKKIVDSLSLSLSSYLVACFQGAFCYDRAMHAPPQSWLFFHSTNMASHLIPWHKTHIKNSQCFLFQPSAICAARPWPFATQLGPQNSRMGSTRREPCLSPKPWCMTTYRQRERSRERDWRKINAHLMCKLMHLMLIQNGRKNYIGWEQIT